jgi:3-oxoacyl-[acyl-carrier-protein] synthase-3
MQAAIRAIVSYLPGKVLSNDQLAAEFTDWTAAKISEKTGIDERRVTTEDECSSDLAVQAGQRLFDSGACAPSDIDYVLLCTQSPDYFLPTTACMVQHRLGIPTTSGAIDFNLGCSGWVAGLGLANGLILSRQARRVLLITAETYSKFIHPADKSVRTIFGDAAAATLVEAVEDGAGGIGPFVYGTDGSGAANLIVPTGGMRRPRTAETAVVQEDDQGNRRSQDNLFMNGPEIFNFTLRIVPPMVNGLLERAGLAVGDVDWFVFHQANHYMLEHLRKKLKVPAEKYPIIMRHCGNTVSSTIPIALESMIAEGKVRSGQRVMVVGFGVGYSWAAAMLRWA